LEIGRINVAPHSKLNHPRLVEQNIFVAVKGTRCPVVESAFRWLSLLAASYLKTGQTEIAGLLLRELEIQSHTDKKALYGLAMNYAELGRTAEAVTALEECFEVHEQRMMWVSVEPRFANLRTEPRFRQILGKMRLN
jgi:hypothetical protein